MMPTTVQRRLSLFLPAVFVLAATGTGYSQGGPARSRQPSVAVPSASSGGGGSAVVPAPSTSGGGVPASQLPSNYVLSPNDLIQVKVFQEDDMDWTVRVTKDSNVNLPVVGVVNVKDKTPEQLGATVRDRLHDGYLVHPQVNISVLEFSKRRFTILGQVAKPGQIDFPDNSGVNVLQAIGMAGGTSKNADPSHVYVKRRVGTQEIVLTVDARRMARDARMAPFEILPGDTITVAETIF